MIHNKPPEKFHSDMSERAADRGMRNALDN